MENPPQWRTALLLADLAIVYMLKPYAIPRAQLTRVAAHAVAAARTNREICGLIIDNGFCLELLECKNKSRRPASFSFYFGEVRSIVKAVGVLGHEVTGTFHSHPAGLAEPGKSDIANAVDDSLMLIVDSTDRKIGLWRIKNGKTLKVPFDQIDHRGARPG